MEYRLFLRSRYGNAFATELPDGRVIPWRPLTIGEFLEYDSLLKVGQYPRAAIENEVFKKCVLDQGIVQGMDHTKAGIVSTVVAAIFAISGPQSPEEMNQIMNFHRMQANGVIPYIVSLICQAFPAYKPEEVYAMDYATLMTRLAQAEHKLLRTGLITEPVQFFHQDEQGSPKTKEPPRKQKVDSSKLFEKYYEGKRQTPPRTVKPPPAPVKPSTSSNKIIITDNDIQEHTTHYTGHEKEDRIILEHQMVKQTTSIYKDYMEKVAKGEKVVIPSHEERMAAAKQRMKANEERARQAMLARQEQKQIEQKEVIKEKAKARVAAKKKR